MTPVPALHVVPDNKEISALSPAAHVGKRLVAAKLITNDQLQIALHEQRQTGGLLGSVLVRLGFLDESALANVLADRTGLQRVDLQQIVLEPDLFIKLPHAVALRCFAVPLSLNDDILEVAMADPYDVVAMDEIRRHFPRQVDLVPYVASKSEIVSVLEDYYGFAGSLDSILDELEQETASADSAHPVVRLVNTLLGDAVRQGASDVHLEPENNLVRVRYRLDGVLEQVREIHRSHWPALSQRLKLMSGMNIAEQHEIQDGRFDLTYNGRRIDFRVALMPTVWGENIVVRILDQRRALLPLHALGFSSAGLETLAQIAERPEGITLVTGPTGSGKTTTLYSILNRLSHTEVNIATLEEPVEYELNLIRQTSIVEEQGISFAAGVRAVLRQDPDIIFIGEIRDGDTAQMALRAAMTGHQVFATLHCNDVWSAVPRLVDLGLNPRVLAGHVNGIIAQRLVRKLCPHCKVVGPASAEECRVLRCDPAAPPRIAVPIGCPQCRKTGRQGRTVISEILRLTPEIDDLMMKESGRVVLGELSRQQGFVSLQQDGIARVLHQEIALADLRRAVDMGRGV
jgi:general secretion pathway protein E/type IV pilus assembly protein PilB